MKKPRLTIDPATAPVKSAWHKARLVGTPKDPLLAAQCARRVEQRHSSPLFLW
jgi:hypothetical protein